MLIAEQPGPRVIPGSHRALSLKTTATTSFTATPEQVTFTPQGSQVPATAKGAMNTVDVFSGFSVNSSGGLTALGNAATDAETMDTASAADGALTRIRSVTITGGDARSEGIAAA